MKNWLFVYKDNGWWLKLTTEKELSRYMMESVNHKYVNAFKNFLYGKEYNSRSYEHCPYTKEASLTLGVVLHGENNKQNILESILTVYKNVYEDMLDSIQKTGAIFVNKNSGYHVDYNHSKSDVFVRRDKIEFPFYEQQDIRIKQFPLGEHYYAYVGDMQVRNNNRLKWNTYEEAYQEASKYIKG